MGEVCWVGGLVVATRVLPAGKEVTREEADEAAERTFKSILARKQALVVGGGGALPQVVRAEAVIQPTGCTEDRFWPCR